MMKVWSYWFDKTPLVQIFRICYVSARVNRVTIRGTLVPDTSTPRTGYLVPGHLPGRYLFIMNKADRIYNTHLVFANPRHQAYFALPVL